MKVKIFQRIYLWWKERRFRKLKKKKVEDLFTEIYTSNIWGKGEGEFYSGDGSRGPNIQIYAEKLTNFINERKIKKILDIGCGDFSIMKEVLSATDAEYIGIDVVDKLIKHHQKFFQNERIQFKKINAIDEDLPHAELVIIRQVLQHLSNNQITKILSKIDKFKYALITEHVPITSDVIFNLDKINGPHIRMRINSGVFIDKAPFNINNTKVFWEYRQDDLVKGKLVPAVIRTYIVENK